MKLYNIFVYGTLLSGASRPASEMVGADVLTEGTVEGSIYDLGWYPGFQLEIPSEGEGVVRGELIAVDEEGLERLDAYEGVPSLYKRAEVTVTAVDGTYHDSYIYVYNGPVHDDDLIHSGDWLAYSKKEEMV